jgi:methylmalonyl-CoA mutase cobalamin-binding subunit
MRFSSVVFLTVLFSSCNPGFSAPPESAPVPQIVWHADRQRMDANLQGLTVEKALGKFSAVTGWRVYLESQTSFDVSAKFENVPAGEGLKLMLGNLSFAIVPQTNGPAKVFVYRTTLAAAKNLVAAEKRKSSLIGNELIIRLKPGSTNAARLAESVHGTVLGRLDALRAYRLQFADDAAAQAARLALQSSPDVAAISSNYAMEQPSPVDPALGAAANPFQLKAQSPDNTGKIVVGLIDMPVQNISPAMQQFLLPSISAAGQTLDVNAETTPTHGTSMAEIILNQLAASSGPGGSSPVRLLPVDVYGASQTTTSFDVAAGITAAVNAGANVINLSLGGDGNSDLLHSVIQQAKAQGVEFFAAAGNTPVTTDTYPAAYPEVVAVTAVQPGGAPASYANRGSFVAIGAPGDGVVAYDGSSWVVSGTSTSTAKATGAFAAGAASNPSESFTQLQAQFEAQFAFKKPAGP